MIRSRAEATHVADFLGIPATGRRVSWETVTIVKIKDGRIVENRSQPDLWGIYQQLTATVPPQE